MDLADTILLALANNPGTRADLARAEAAAAAAGVARSAYWPRIEAEFRGGSDQWYTPAANGVDRFRRVEATTVLAVGYVLLDFGRRAANVSAALEKLDAAGLGYQRRVQSVVFEVQQAWFASEAAWWKERAAFSMVEAAAIALETIEKEKTLGLASAPQLLEARKRLFEARFGHEQALNDLRISEGQIRLAAGLPANAPAPFAFGREAPDARPLAERVDALIVRALDQRPDLAARAAEMRASEAEVRAARADFFPEVRIEGSYANSSFGYRAHAGKQHGQYETGLDGYAGFVVVSWDLFDGFERVSRLEQTKAEREASGEILRGEWLRVTGDVWNAFHAYLTSQSRLEYANRWLESAREDLAAIDAEFREGLQDRATLTELRALEAMARYEQAAAVSDFSTRSAALAFALGNFSGAPAPSSAANSRD